MSNLLKKTIDKLPLIKNHKTKLKEGIDDLVGNDPDDKEFEFPLNYTTIYVDGTNGSDANDGYTREKPKRSMTVDSMILKHRNIRIILLSDATMTANDSSMVVKNIHIVSDPLSENSYYLHGVVTGPCRNITLEHCILQGFDVSNVPNVNVINCDAQGAFTVTGTPNRSKVIIDNLTSLANANVTFTTCDVIANSLRPANLNIVSDCYCYIKELILSPTCGTVVCHTSDIYVEHVEDYDDDHEIYGPILNLSVNSSGYINTKNLKNTITTKNPSFVVSGILKLETPQEKNIYPSTPSPIVFVETGSICELNGELHTQNITE